MPAESSNIRSFSVRGQVIGDSFFLIAGPDLVDPLDLCLRVAERLAKACGDLEISCIYKGSFDKANRTSMTSYRGPGLEAGLRNLEAVRAETGLPVITDVHSCAQLPAIAEVVDVLQLPAFLCRQTDLLAACAKTGLPIHVKKGQWMAPWDMEHVVGKLTAAGATDIMLCDRGTAFGYNMWVSDLRGMTLMAKYGHPVVYDASHSQQLPAGRGDRSGGMGELIPAMARAAVAAGAHGLFVECHEAPETARVDPDTHIELGALEALLPQLVAIHGIIRDSH